MVDKRISELPVPSEGIAAGDQIEVNNVSQPGSGESQRYTHDEYLINQQRLNFRTSTELTIAAGVVTRTQSWHTVDTAADAATDDLDTIDGGAEGDICIIRANNAARTVVIKHNTGNILTTTGNDISLIGTTKWALLIYDATLVKWLAMSSTREYPATILIGGVLHRQMWVGGWKPTITNGCAQPAQIEMGANKNVYDYCAFDKDAIEYAYANWPLPDDYSGGVVYGMPYWLHPAATAFKVSWGLQAVAIANDGTLDVAQGTAIYSDDTGGTTSDFYYGPLTTAITIAGTPAAKKLVNWRASRMATDAVNDTLDVDGYLLGWLIWYPVSQ